MIISVDGGGSKTKAVLYDDNGKIIKQVITGSCHPNNCNEEEIINHLNDCLLDDDSPIVFGLAGYTRSIEIKSKIDELVYKVCKNHRYKIIPDTQIALYSCVEDKDGIIVILGTGSVALRKVEDQITQKGGFGFILGDEGSGFIIGQAVLRRYILEADGRKDKTVVFEEINHLYNLSSANDLISIVINNGIVKRDMVAKASCIAFKYPNLFKDVICDNARQVSELIESIYLDNLPVYLTGGLTNNKLYVDEIKNNLPNIKIEVNKHEPVYGGYIYGKYNPI